MKTEKVKNIQSDKKFWTIMNDLLWLSWLDSVNIWQM